MALVLDATAKGADSNSYVTTAEAATYFEGRFDVDEWDAAVIAETDDVALVMATSRLELEMYDGLPTTTTQRLEWPRSGCYDLNGTYLDSDVVPRCVKEACFELALALLKDTSLLSDTGLEGFKELAAGPLHVTPRASWHGGELPAQVRRSLRSVRIDEGVNVHVERS